MIAQFNILFNRFQTHEFSFFFAKQYGRRETCKTNVFMNANIFISEYEIIYGILHRLREFGTYASCKNN